MENGKINSPCKDVHRYTASYQLTLVTGVQDCYAFVWVTHHRRLICTGRSLRLQAWKQVPSTPLRGHKCIEKLIHGLSWLTVLPYTYIHVYVYSRIHIFKQSNRCHWLIREQGWEHTALLLLPVNPHLNIIHGRFHHTAVSYTRAAHTQSHGLPVLLPTLLQVSCTRKPAWPSSPLCSNLK